MKRHNRIPLLKAAQSGIKGICLWGSVILPAMAETDQNEGIGTVFVISGVILVLMIIFILNRVRKMQESGNVIVFERMNAGIMEGRLNILIASLEDLIDGLSYRLQHDRQSVLEQFRLLSAAKDRQWQEDFLDLAKQSSFDMGEGGRIRKGLDSLLDLLQLENEIRREDNTDTAMLAGRIIDAAGRAEEHFRDARYKLVVC